MVRMADTRNCDQCGTQFTPRREHGRFCSARCRVAWNRSHVQGPVPHASALEWSIAAMIDVTDRLPRIRSLDRAHAFAIIGDAVWWVTIVDGTLVRYHPDAYDLVLSERPRDRGAIEETLAGLRFVRNRMGHDADHVDFIHLRPGRADRINRVTDWRWSSLPEQNFDWLSPRGQEWESDRYQAYEHRLAGQTVGDTFTRAASFLKIAAAQAEAAVAVAGSAVR
jgi:hypothetical protein